MIFSMRFNHGIPLWLVTEIAAVVEHGLGGTSDVYFDLNESWPHIAPFRPAVPVSHAQERSTSAVLLPSLRSVRLVLVCG